MNISIVYVTIVYRKILHLLMLFLYYIKMNFSIYCTYELIVFGKRLSKTMYAHYLLNIKKIEYYVDLYSELDLQYIFII